MKRIFLGYGLISIMLVISFLFAPISVHALGSAQITLPPDVLGVIVKIALGFASLVGVSNLVAVLVQLLKIIHVAQDSTASQWAAGLNLMAFIALVYFGVFQPQISFDILNGYAAQITTIILFMLGFVVQITQSKPAYDALKASQVPLLSYSYSRG